MVKVMKRTKKSVSLVKYCAKILYALNGEGSKIVADQRQKNGRPCLTAFHSATKVGLAGGSWCSGVDRYPCFGSICHFLHGVADNSSCDDALLMKN